jgi:hypothetical protein
MVELVRSMSALEDMVLLLLDTKSVLEAQVRNTVGQLGEKFFPALTSEHFDMISMQLQERLAVELELGVAVTAKEHEPWLVPVRKQSINWRRWSAYRKLLIQQGRGLKVLDGLGDATDSILDLAGDPNAVGSWQRRGLVIGEVQSGKTSTYIGLLNKAADAGYRLFILIGGHTESLRRQTQSRVDEGFVGRDSAYMSKELRHLVDQKLVGVGTIDPEIRAYGFTTITSDFSIRIAQGFNFEVRENISEPVVLVVKKNTKILQNLHKWLADQAPAGGHKMPLMLLDDEADYASINTREEDDPTAVNGAIRDLLTLSQRSSYVGFTATPFANVLIDNDNTEDLFPRDFIYALESPSNYFGADVAFGEDSVNTLRSLDDAEPFLPLRHKSTLKVDALPESLVDAIGTFILANAIRDLRGDELEPRSMLVNVSRFNRVQQQVHDLVDDQLAAFRNAIEFDSVEPGQSPSLERLHILLQLEFGECGYTWLEVLEILPKSVVSMQAVLVNSRTNSAEAYSKLAAVGRTRIIATGGAVLSRGLTLNGLMTSYFYQKSRASDTLMQMGRWFGYRDSYRDLCRLWIDDEVASWYGFIAESVRELREDLKEMQRLGLTPKDFGLKVRKHPESLLVTAANKAKAAKLVERVVSLRDSTLESPKILNDPKLHLSNYAAAKALVAVGLSQANVSNPNGTRVVLSSMPKTAIADFLDAFGSAPSDQHFGGPTLSTGRSYFADFVRNPIDEDLDLWDVVVVGGSEDDSESFGSVQVPRVKRGMTLSDGALLISGANRRVAGTSDIGALLSDADRAELKAPALPISEKSYRSKLVRPAILLYFIQAPLRTKKVGIKEGELLNLASNTPIVAIKVAFPADPLGLAHDAQNKSGVRYLINTVLQRAWLPEFGLDLDAADMEDLDA